MFRFESDSEFGTESLDTVQVIAKVELRQGKVAKTPSTSCKVSEYRLEMRSKLGFYEPCGSGLSRDVRL